MAQEFLRTHCELLDGMFLKRTVHDKLGNIDNLAAQFGYNPFKTTDAQEAGYLRERIDRTTNIFQEQNTQTILAEQNPDKPLQDARFIEIPVINGHIEYHHRPRRFGFHKYNVAQYLEDSRTHQLTEGTTYSVWKGPIGVTRIMFFRHWNPVHFLKPYAHHLEDLCEVLTTIETALKNYIPQQ